MSLHRRAPGDGRRAGPRPRHPDRPLRLLRPLPRARRPLAGGGGHRARVLRQPLQARSGWRSGFPTRPTTPSRTRSARTSARPSPRATETTGCANSRPPNTCVAPVYDVAEVVRAIRSLAEPAASFGEARHPEAGSLPAAGAGAGRECRARTHPPRCVSAADGYGHRRAAGRGRAVASGRDRVAHRSEESGGVSELPAEVTGLDRPEALRAAGRVRRGARLRLHHLRVGGERQPALLEREGRRRDLTDGRSRRPP